MFKLSARTMLSAFLTASSLTIFGLQSGSVSSMSAGITINGIQNLSRIIFLLGDADASTIVLHLCYSYLKVRLVIFSHHVYIFLP
ncbi:MAG: hypothetical protein H7A26_02070 [Spirochaetales bacterium]|nr:hypothetical protein [Spirochaetales bacterium]